MDKDERFVETPKQSPKASNSSKVQTYSELFTLPYQLSPTRYQTPSDINQTPTKHEPYNIHCSITFPSFDGSKIQTKRERRNAFLTSPNTTSDPPLVQTSVDGHETAAQELDLSKMKDWSPSDDGLPTLTKSQLDFMKLQNRILPDDVFDHYKYTKRLEVFRQHASDDNHPQTKPQEDQ